MSASHVETACGLIDPEQHGILPLDLVPVREVITLLATQLAEVDRLTRAIAKCYGSDESDGLTPYEQLDSIERCWEMEHNDAGRHHLEVDRLTRELEAERAAREHTWETLGKRTEELAERTRERDDALLEAAARLRDDDAWDGLHVRVLDLAAKWAALGGEPRDKRSTTYAGCSSDILALATEFATHADDERIIRAADAGAWFIRAQLAAAKYIDENMVTVDDTGRAAIEAAVLAELAGAVADCHVTITDHETGAVEIQLVAHPEEPQP